MVTLSPKFLKTMNTSDINDYIAITGISSKLRNWDLYEKLI